MKYLPTEDFYIVTPLTPGEVQSRIEQETEAGRRSVFSKILPLSSKYFSGYVANGTFELERIISYRNSFLPVIKGSIQPENIGSRVHIKMHLQILLIVFMGIWVSFLLFLSFAFLSKESPISTGFNTDLLIPPGMLVFACLITIIGFKYEASKARKKLLHLLDGTLEMQ